MAKEFELTEGGANHQKPLGDDDVMTTEQGHPVADDQNWLSAGARGPQLLEDHIAREKIFHFDHERIPERVVHALVQHLRHGEHADEDEGAEAVEAVSLEWLQLLQDWVREVAVLLGAVFDPEAVT